MKGAYNGEEKGAYREGGQVEHKGKLRVGTYVKEKKGACNDKRKRMRKGKEGSILERKKRREHMG